MQAEVGLAHEHKWETRWNDWKKEDSPAAARQVLEQLLSTWASTRYTETRLIKKMSKYFYTRDWTGTQEYIVEFERRRVCSDKEVLGCRRHESLCRIRDWCLGQSVEGIGVLEAHSHQRPFQKSIAGESIHRMIGLSYLSLSREQIG